MSNLPYQDLSRSIDGKTALITGAASGMGRATAHLFARQGANVAVTDLKQENVDIVVQEIRDAGFSNVHGWALDVSDADAIKRVVDEIAAGQPRHVGVADGGGVAGSDEERPVEGEQRPAEHDRQRTVDEPARSRSADRAAATRASTGSTGIGVGAIAASSSATASETERSTEESGTSRAPHSEASSSEDASFCPRSISEM